MSVAQLGFQIDSSQAAGAASDLDKLTSAAARTEQAATKVSGAGTRMSRGFADLNPALDKIIGSLGRLEGIAGSIDKRLDMMSSAATRAAKANSVLDQSAVEASTAYKQLEASLNAVTAAQKKSDAAQGASLAMIDKQKAAIASLRAEIAKLHNTPMPNQPNPANNNVPTGGQGGVGNIAAQFFDIGATAAFMNPATVAIQQGPQLAQAFAGQSTKQALAGLAGGLAAIVSPLSLAAIGLTGVAAAAIQYGVGLVSASDDTKKLEEAMERHDGVMKRLEDRYGALVTAAKGYTVESAKVLQFEVGSDERALRRETKNAGKAVFDQANSGFFNTTLNPFSGSTVDGMFQDAIFRLQKTAREGKPDFDAFYESLEKTAAIDPNFAKRADELAALVDQFRLGTKALEEMERVQNRIFNDRGPNGMLLSQGPTNQADMGNLALFNSREGVAARRRQQGVDAQIASINARSPQERAAAARASAAAQYNNDETAAARRARIEQAGVVALTQAEKQLTDARRDRASSLDKLLTDQQTEIDLIGKTGGAAVALRKEYELTSQLRLDAARQGIEVDQRELDLIKERTAALGELTDQYNQSKFNFDMNQQMSDMRLSAKDLAVVTRLRQAGLPEDLSGSNAQMVRSQIQSQEQKDAIDRFSSNLANNIIQSGGNIGEAFGKTFLAALQESATKQLTQIFQQIFTGLLGGTGGASGAGIGGVVGTVAAAAMGRSSNDNKSGAYSGLAGVVPVTRAPLGNIPNTDVASYIAKAAAARGIDPSIALKVAQSEGGLKSWNLQSTYMKNGVQEPSFGPYQLYMGGGLGNAFQKKTGLDPRLAANGPAGVDFALDNAKQSGWGAWYGAAKVGVGKWDGINSGGGASAADAVSKLADSAKAATGGLDTLGGGLGKLGQTLSTSFFPAAPTGGSGGGGIFSWIGGLFGGGGDLSKYKGLTGLFADGTNYAPGGMALVGERGPELVNLPQGSQVFDTNRSNRMRGDNGKPTLQPAKYDIHVYGGSGDDHIRMLVKDGVMQAESQQREQDRRGQFGETQRRYSNQKGLIVARYLNQPTLYVDFLRPTRMSFSKPGSGMAGGKNILSESVSTGFTGGGMISGVYESCVIFGENAGDDERHEYIGMLAARLNGGFRFINVPILNDGIGPFPFINGKRRPIIKGIPHSDGALFSDTSGYSQSTVWAKMLDAAALNAGQIRIRIYGAARDLRWSDWFSIYHDQNGDKSKGWRAYSYWESEKTEEGSEVIDGVSQGYRDYVLGITPPLREAAPAGTRIEFARPMCVMKFADGFELSGLEYKANYSSRPTLNFSEAF